MTRKANSSALTEPSEIKAELLALAGSAAEYNVLLASISEQLRARAQEGHRIAMKGDKVVSVSVPAKKKRLRNKVTKVDEPLAIKC